MSDVEMHKPEYDEPPHVFEYIYVSESVFKFILSVEDKLSNAHIEDSSGKIVKNIKLPEGDKGVLLTDLNRFLVNNVSEERIAMLTKSAKLVLQIE